MNENYCDITFVLDRSGSMQAIRDDTIGGFNSFIEDQKRQDGKCTLTLVQFDDIYEFVHKGKNIRNVPKLTNKTYVPRGSTALMDAIGRAINETGARLATMSEKERPAKVLFVIQTDGYENASREFNRSKIKEMIQHQRTKYNWEFIFLGADENAIAQGAEIGIDFGKTLKFTASSIGTKCSYDTMSRIATQYRATGFAPDFTDEDRNNQAAA